MLTVVTACGSTQADAATSVDIAAVPADPPVPAAGPVAATGTYASPCGRDEQGHYNADNLVMSPGVVGGARHVHEYVGNLTTDALATPASLAEAATSCADGDRSSYFWPVLLPGGAAPPPAGARTVDTRGFGTVIAPDSVLIEFRGNAVSNVIPMPAGLAMQEGDPMARDETAPQVRARWGCSSAPDRGTPRYPRCPPGAQLTRTMDFPGCWNGLSTDSPDHHSHVRYATASGACPHNTFPVPQLRIVLSYALPAGTPFLVDGFPEVGHAPSSDHAMFIDVMTDAQMSRIVDCLNQGRRC